MLWWTCKRQAMSIIAEIHEGTEGTVQSHLTYLRWKHQAWCPEKGSLAGACGHGDMHSSQLGMLLLNDWVSKQIIINSIYLCRKLSNIVVDGCVRDNTRNTWQWWKLPASHICVCVWGCVTRWLPHFFMTATVCTTQLQTWKQIISPMTYTHSVFSVCIPMLC